MCYCFAQSYPQVWHAYDLSEVVAVDKVLWHAIALFLQDNITDGF